MIFSARFVYFNIRFTMLVGVLCAALQSGGQCITSFPSVVSFESNNGGWTTGGTANDWAWGTPSKNIIKTTIGGNKCWISGGLNKGSYSNGQASWIKSRCYDFSNLKYPAVGFNVYWETEYNYDGAVLQYSTNGSTWINVGSASDPKNCLNGNWFNSNVKFLGNGNGWSGSSVKGTDGSSCLGGNGSNGWVVASHTMPYLAGKPKVEFRFFFGAGVACNGYNGFAFDNFTIGEAPANVASFTFNCTTSSTVSFTNTSPLCPTYSWDFGDPASGPANSSTATNPTHSFSGAGQYTVSLTASGPDNAPSTTTQVVTILDLTTQVVSEPLCNGAANGSVTVTALPAVAGLNYSWNSSPTQLTQTAANLAAGTYVVTVSGNNVCTTTDNATLTDPPLLVNSKLLSQPTCKNNDGNITLNTTGGTGPYTYLWTPNVSTANTGSSLGGGTYSVLIKDKNGCSLSESIILTAPSSVTAAITASKDATCFGFATGSATVTASGGTAPYTYSWAPAGGTSATAPALSKNNYTVTVTDASGCTATASAIINEPAVLSSKIAVTNNACGQNNGTANVTVTGGTAPYTYAWSPGGANTAAITNLSSQDYTITITDKNGCVATDVASIKTSGTTLSLQVSKTDVLCVGDATGTASVSVSGGTAPYSYLWSNGAATAAANGLKKGTYSVTVKDALGCSASSSVDVGEPVAALSVSLTATDALCNGGTGNVSALVTGGTAPYSYAWSNGAATQNIATAPAGTYSLNLTDKNGCKASGSATVSAPAALAVSINVTSASCGASNGTATAQVTGGTAPYTYAWSPGGATTASIQNLTSASYSLQVTDKNGCNQGANAIVPGSTNISLQVSKTDVLCFGDATGTATVTVTGGVAPYSYTWSNGAGTAKATNLNKGNYSITVKDASGCSNTSSVTITEPAASLALTVSHTDALCNGGTGTVNAQVTGGTPGYTYLWSNGATGNNLTDVVAGGYTINVTDKNGCTATAGTVVAEPALLVVSVIATATTCGNSNGTVTANVSGGVPPYAYAWSNGSAVSVSQSNLNAGQYDVIVTDNNGCVKRAWADVNFSTNVTLQVTKTDVACAGSSTGTASVAVTGGKSPYNIAWSNGASTAAISGLAAATYNVLVKDASGCSANASLIIAEPATPLNVALVVSDAFCSNGSGSIQTSVSGGTTPYTYSWSDGTTGNRISAVGAGLYGVTVTDKNGCKATGSATVKAPPAVTISFVIKQATCGGTDGSITTSVSGGTAPYSYLWAGSGKTTADLSNVGAGNYTLNVTDKNNCIASQVAVVTTPGNLQIQTSSTNILCNGDKSGTAVVKISGGSPAYSILWSNGATTASIGALSGGTYTVVVKDASGCSSTGTVAVTEPAALTLNTSALPTICLTNSGSVNSIVSGGSQPYLYNWQPGNVTTAGITGLGAGSYSLQVTDKNGCKKTAASIVTAVNPLRISLGKDTTICDNAGFSITPGSFTSYQWQNGSNAASFSVAGPGKYWVNVTDQRGCSASDTLQVVADCGEIWFPTGFTPNADGKNDLFGPLGNLNLISNYSMVVFDRWGSKVFESYNPSEKWNGYYKGKMLAGNFVWFARYQGRTGQVVKKGSLVLIR